MKIKKLCIIAGAGNLPQIAINEAEKNNIDYCVYSLIHDANATAFKSSRSEIPIRMVSAGRFNEILSFLTRDEITHVLFAGKIEKAGLLKNIRFNLQTLALLKKLKNQNDKSIFNLIASEMEKIGVRILKQDAFLKSLLLKPGEYSRKKPSSEDWENIRFGMKYAQDISALDIGQCVVVARKTLISVEAIEGTDETILRSGRYLGKHYGVVCKTMRKSQDTRFDVPTVSLTTLESMHTAQCKVLAVEAGRTFVVDQENFFKKINAYKMIFVVV